MHNSNNNFCRFAPYFSLFLGALSIPISLESYIWGITFSVLSLIFGCVYKNKENASAQGIKKVNIGIICSSLTIVLSVLFLIVLYIFADFLSGAFSTIR